MAGPMPPQGQPPQGGPPPQGGQPDPGGPDGDEGGGQKGAGQVIVETDKNLSMLAQAAPPQFAGKLKQISDAFRSVVQDMMQAAQGGAPQGGPPRGPSTPEQGGNANAQPAGY